MNFYYNILDTVLLHDIEAERTNKLKEQVWNCSSLFWEDGIKTGISGSCVATFLSDTLKDRIYNCIRYYLPEHTELNMQHYVWLKNSGISLHDDGSHKFGGTIYLNETWNINHGGIFLWQDSETQYRGVAPKHNMMVVNSSKTPHMVTPVSTEAPEPRYTIQIWGK